MIPNPLNRPPSPDAESYALAVGVVCCIVGAACILVGACLGLGKVIAVLAKVAP